MSDDPKTQRLQSIIETVQLRSRGDNVRHKTLPRPRRPRIPGSKAGGWKGHPNSLAALDAHRHKGGAHPGSTTRRCDKCGRLAVAGLFVCNRHGGQGEIIARKRADPKFKPKRSYVIRRELNKALRDGQVPLELMQQPMFLRIMRIVIERPRAEDGVSHVEAGQRWREACRLLLEFMMAWVALTEHRDNVPWATVVLKARNAGYGG